MWVRRFGYGLVTIASLSGCQVKMPASLGGAKPATETLRFSSSGFEVMAPDGYCFDTASLREDTQGSFVLMAACDPLLGHKVASDSSKISFLSVTLTQPLEETSEVTAEALHAHFQAEEAHGVLARSGAAEDITVVWSGVQDDLFLVHAIDSSRDDAVGVSQDLWRGITLVEGRLLSVSSAQLANTGYMQPENKSLVLQVVESFQSQAVTEAAK